MSERAGDYLLNNYRSTLDHQPRDASTLIVYSLLTTRGRLPSPVVRLKKEKSKMHLPLRQTQLSGQHLTERGEVVIMITAFNYRKNASSSDRAGSPLAFCARPHLSFGRVADVEAVVVGEVRAEGEGK